MMKHKKLSTKSKSKTLPVDNISNLLVKAANRIKPSEASGLVSQLSSFARREEANS